MAGGGSYASRGMLKYVAIPKPHDLLDSQSRTSYVKAAKQALQKFNIIFISLLMTEALKASHLFPGIPRQIATYFASHLIQYGLAYLALHLK